MQDVQKNTPIKMNMDKASGSLSPEEAFYLLNHERSLMLNGKKRSSLGKSTGMVANYAACEMQQPAGENYSIGTYKSPLTNEQYDWVYNSNGVHYIRRISKHGCEVVYHGCLKLSPEPEHSIEPFRAYLKITKTCRNRAGKDLVWCDGSDNPIGQLDVEASIATNFFTTPFFEHFCGDPCVYVQHVVPKTCGCITAEYIPLPAAETGLANNLLDRGFKFIYRHRYYDGRVGEWSDPSTLYYQDSKGCFEGGIGFSRCMKLRLHAGNPMVEKVEIGFTEDNGLTWYLYDTIEKYNPYTSAKQQWYERTLSPDVSTTLTHDCYFTTTFCNNKQRTVIDPEEVKRVYNPYPRAPQGLIPVKNSIGFYNYKKGTCPISQAEVKKAKIAINCKASNNCDIQYAKVTVRAVIHNTGYHTNEMIFRMKSGSTDVASDRAWFGGLRIRSNEYRSGVFGGSPTAGEGWITGYDQYFRGKARNFTVYIEGTEYYGEMEQWRADRLFNSRQKVGIISGFEERSVRNELRSHLEHGTFYYQEYTFRVPKGTAGALRIQSHQAESHDPHTSTFIIGTTQIGEYKGDANITDTGKLLRDREEIWFDTCDGDVELTETFVIQDNAVDLSLQKKASAYYGYIKDENNDPVEGLYITDHNSPSRVRSVTDHNGFYHFYIRDGYDEPMTFDILGERDASSSFKKLKEFVINSESGANVEANVIIYDNDVPNYKNDFFAKLKVVVKDCSGNGIGGVRVVLSGSRFKITDRDGTATFRVRNYGNMSRNFRSTIADPSGCFSLDCFGGCNPCFHSVLGSRSGSYSGRPPISLGDIIINRNQALVNRAGLKGGGRYGFGFVVEGDDRVSPVNKIVDLDIPSTQQKKKLGFCDFDFDFTGLQLEPWAKCIKIVRTLNMNPYALQWVVDKVERTSEGKLKLTIQSLSDYNEQYFFKTNTAYGYVKGDRVEFIRNGDNELFDAATYGNMTFLTLSPFHDRQTSGKKDGDDADFFNQLLINDDDRLSGLKEGALIELKRASVTLESQVYYTICANIPVTNGRVDIEKGTFHTFDTYLVNRKVGKFPPMLFEHHTPNDFWANPTPMTPAGFMDIGKPHAYNPYEDERRYGRNITISAATQMNVYGYIEKTFEGQEQGDIIAMGISDASSIIGICENDWFTAQTANDFLKVANDGTIRTLRGSESISDPQPKAGMYGCRYEHVGSVLLSDNFASWYDQQNDSYAFCNWSTAKAISDGQCQSYFVRMGQAMRQHNDAPFIHQFDKYRCITGWDKVTGRVMLTLKSLRHAGIDNAFRAFDNPNNTITFDPSTGDCTGFVSFTPERYGHIELNDGQGCSLISYLHGEPYIHPEIPTKMNEFFGVPCDRVIGISLNKDKDKIKLGLSMEIQDQMMWFSPEVRTESASFRSEIPPIYFERDGDKWNGSFMSNINSPEGLFGEEFPKGYAIDIVLVRDNTIDNKYRSIDPIKQTQYDELDSILLKFEVVEQSGFTENK